MGTIEHIRKARLGLIEQFGFREDELRPGFAIGVPDDVYPVEIDGTIYYVRIINGEIDCCNIRTGSDVRAAHI